MSNWLWTGICDHWHIFRPKLAILWLHSWRFRVAARVLPTNLIWQMTNTQLLQLPTSIAPRIHCNCNLISISTQGHDLWHSAQHSKTSATTVFQPLNCKTLYENLLVRVNILRSQGTMYMSRVVQRAILIRFADWINKKILQPKGLLPSMGVTQTFHYFALSCILDYSRRITKIVLSELDCAVECFVTEIRADT